MSRFAVTLLVLTAALGDARADGERSPMFGVTLSAAGTSQQVPMIGGGLEVAWWYGRVGIAGEGAMHWNSEDGVDRTTTLGANLRIRLLDQMLDSLFERRDVELGVELHGIVERTWWNDGRSALHPNAYGVGLAFRLRGGSDWDMSALIAESRLFFRVMTAPVMASDVVARSSEPGAPIDNGRALTFLIGIGGSFGAGEPDYLVRFRSHSPFSPPYSAF